MKYLVPLFLIATLLINCKSDDGCNPELVLNVDQTQLNADIATIDEYLADSSIVAVEDPTGLRYVINEEGMGQNPGLCDAVSITYTSRLLSDESIIENDVSGLGFQLVQLIKGFQIGLPFIKSGGSMTLYIPSGYGYEETGDSRFPSDANLIVDIQLNSVE